jgi:hypothetical protein
VRRHELFEVGDHGRGAALGPRHLRVGEHDHHDPIEVAHDEVLHHGVVLLKVGEGCPDLLGRRHALGNRGVRTAALAGLSQRERRHRAARVVRELEVEGEFAHPFEDVRISQFRRANEEIDVVLEGAKGLG